MAKMMVNMILVFADVERKMIHPQVQEGIDAVRVETLTQNVFLPTLLGRVSTGTLQIGSRSAG